MASKPRGDDVSMLHGEVIMLLVLSFMLSYGSRDGSTDLNTWDSESLAHHILRFPPTLSQGVSPLALSQTKHWQVVNEFVI